MAKKEGSISKNLIPSLKEKVPVIKRNHSISTVKTATTARAKGDGLDLSMDPERTRMVQLRILVMLRKKNVRELLMLLVIILLQE